MPRRIDIEGAFRTAIKHEASGRRTVTTEDFVKHLALHKPGDWLDNRKPG